MPSQIRTLLHIPCSESDIFAGPPLTSLLSAFNLSAREAEIALWICQGKTNGAVAAILGIGVRTVEKHVEHIFLKLRVHNRTAAAYLLQRHMLGQDRETTMYDRT